jgi:uncharacterized membrane protein
MDKLFFAGTLLPVFLAMLAFVGSHFIMSHPLRGPMVRAFGEGPFAGIYAGISLVFFLWAIIAWRAAPIVPLWHAGAGLRWVALGLMLPASLLFIFSLTPKNPTLGPRNDAPSADAARGALAVTRHPMLWSFALWGIAHILANGDVATMIFAGGIIVLSLVGALLIDGKKRRRLGASYEAFMARTGFVPFAAILSGKATLDISAIGLWRIAIGLALFAALIAAHPYVFGVSALPL